MKRFTETTKWSDPWFMDLPTKWKLLWLYLLDNCDNAGVWHPNVRLASVQIGEPFEASEALRVFSGRVETLPTGKWHVSKFIDFQFGQLSDQCKPHKQVFELLSKHGIKRVSKGYPKGIHTLQEQEQEKGKDKETEKEPILEEPEQVHQTATSAAYWQELETKIRGLRNSWKLPFTHEELRALQGAGRCLDGLSDADWKTLRQYLHARLPQGDPGWQPTTRLKFLQTISDVYSHSQRWAEKNASKETRTGRGF